MTIADRWYSGDEGTEAGWLLQLTEQGKAKFHVGNTDGLADAIGVTDLRNGNWHNLIGNYNGSTVKVFVDGNLEGEAIYSDSIDDTPADSDKYGIYIGSRQDCGCTGGTSGYFNGTIDEIRVYNETAFPYITASLRMK
jgi:hypothetical protein